MVHTHSYHQLGAVTTTATGGQPLVAHAQRKSYGYLVTVYVYPLVRQRQRVRSFRFVSEARPTAFQVQQAYSRAGNRAI